MQHGIVVAKKQRIKLTSDNAEKYCRRTTARTIDWSAENPVLTLRL